MLYREIIASNRFRWFTLLLIPFAFLFVWKGLVKPYEIKRLQQKTVQTADNIVDGFSSRSLENLAAIERLFTLIETKYEYYKTHAILINELDTYFQDIPGLELFSLPPEGTQSALVLFNPYHLSSQQLFEKEACTRAMLERPKQL